MKSLFKAALILSGLVVVVVIALVITVATLDPNDHKDWISKKALEMTGRTLVLDGDIDATFYPWLGIEANNVTLGNAAGFGDEAFLYADYLKLRIKLMPMLKEQYEVDTVSIRGAVINLARNEKGVSNWDDLMTEKKDEGSFPLAAVVLGGVDVQKASLNWHDLASDTVYKISNMDIKTDALRYGEPLKLSVDMDFIANKPALNGIINLAGTITYDIDNQIYAIKPLELQAKLKGKNIPEGENDVKLSAVIDLDLDKDTATISDLTIQGLDTQLSGNLNASRIQTTGPSIQASLKGDGTDLAQLFKIAEIEPLASQIAELSVRSFTVDTTLDADLERGDINVSHLALAMLGATVNGEVKARNIFSETPGYKGQLKAAGPDLPTLLEVLGQLQGGSESALTEYSKIISKVKNKDFKIDADFDADMQSGDIDVSDLSLLMLGATVQGNIKARNVQSKTPAYKGQLEAAGPDLPTLLRLLGRIQGGRESALFVYGKKFSNVNNKAFTIKTGFDADLKSGDIDIPSLDIQALGIKVLGNLKAKDMQADKGVVNGKLTISGNKLAGLLVALDQEPLSEVLQSINFDTTISGDPSNLNLKPMVLKAILAGGQVGKKAESISLNADTNINLEKETLSMEGLSLKGLGLNVSGEVKAKKFLQEEPTFSGEIDLVPFDFRSLMNKLNQTLPITAGKNTFTNLGFKTQFVKSKRKLEIKQLVMVLDKTNLSGDFSLVDFDKPVINFDIDIDQINVDRYLPPADKDEGKKPLTPETAAGAAAQLPVETLQALNVDGSLSITDLTLSKMKMTNVELRLVGKDGNIQLKPVGANLYQGSYSGDVTINANGKLPKLVMNSAIKGVQIEKLLKDTTGSADLVGKSDISIAVVAHGRNTDAFKQTLSGQAELKVTEGIVRGVNVKKALRQVEMMIENGRFAKPDTSGNTKFDSLVANLEINAGVVNNNDLLMTAPGFKVTGNGILARLVDMSWKYDLAVAVDKRSVAQDEKTYNLGGYSIPILCRGKIAGENCKPDKLNLAGNAVKKIFLDKLLSPGSTTPAETNAVDKNSDPGKELLDKALKSIFK